MKLSREGNDYCSNTTVKYNDTAIKLNYKSIIIKQNKIEILFHYVQMLVGTLRNTTLRALSFHNLTYTNLKGNYQQLKFKILF